MTSLSQRERITSELRSYSALKFIYDIGSWPFLLILINNCQIIYQLHQQKHSQIILNGQFHSLFLLNFVFSSKFYTMKIVYFSRIRIWTVGAEDKHSGHMTNTMVVAFKKCSQTLKTLSFLYAARHFIKVVINFWSRQILL